MFPVLIELIDRQIRMEFEAAYFYLAASEAMYQKGFTGLAHWLQKQAGEELQHGMRFVSYVRNRQLAPVWEEISPPAFNNNCTPAFLFRLALEHEEAVTESILSLVRQAQELEDCMLEQFLGDFVAEQREEEESVGLILRRLEMARNQPAPLLIIDKEVGESR